ncbi:MAG TPA: metallophosphoesterase [Stenomitos sp.]
MVRRFSFLRNRWITRFGLVFALVLGLTTYACAIEPNWYEVRNLQLTLPRLAPEFSGYRIVHLSDIHADRWMTSDRLQRVVGRVNRLQPDLVVLTGDFITRSPETYTPTLTALRALQAPDGAVGVLGNHDIASGAEFVAQSLAKSGVQVLENQVDTIVRKGAELHIAGVGDVWYGRAHLEQIMPTLPDTGAAILLAHEPDFAEVSAATQRFDLQLSGHSHGGQVYVPPFKRLVPALADLYPSGLYRVGSMWQYTNRGIGASPLHLRLNCRPEITVITLNSPKTAPS